MSAMAALVLLLAAGECGRRRRRGSSSQHLDMAPDPDYTQPRRRGRFILRAGAECGMCPPRARLGGLLITSGSISNTAQVTPLQGGGGWGARYHDIIVLRPVIQFIIFAIFINKDLKSLRDPLHSTLHFYSLFSHIAVI